MTLGEVAGALGQTMAKQGAACSLDYILIEGMLCMFSQFLINNELELYCTSY